MLHTLSLPLGAGGASVNGGISIVVLSQLIEWFCSLWLITCSFSVRAYRVVRDGSTTGIVGLCIGVPNPTTRCDHPGARPSTDCFWLAAAPKPSYKLPVRRNPGNLATVGGLAAIVLWSTTFAFTRSLSEQVGTLTAGTAVYLIGGGLCLARLAWLRKGTTQFLKLPRVYLVGCGFLFIFYSSAIYLAVGLSKDRKQLLEIALLNYLWPALTILFSLPLLKKRASLWLVPGTVLALTGVFLVLTQEDRVSWASWREHLQSSPAAYLLALAAAVAWALYSNLARRWSGPEGDGAVELFVLATGLALLALRFTVTEPTNWDLQALAEASALAAITALAYVTWEAAMRKGNLLLVLACSYFTPLLSTFVSCIYLSVPQSPKLWIGCLLLVSGSLISWRSVTDQPVPSRETSDQRQGLQSL